MDKVTERTSALEIKMMNNHKELMNKIETVEKKKQTKHYNSQRNMKQKQMKLGITKSKLRTN